MNTDIFANLSFVRFHLYYFQLTNKTVKTEFPSLRVLIYLNINHLYNELPRH